jgi:O-antigen/teichoic acid export membrane protein
MLKNISFVSLSFLYINILGYIFHFYVSRHLGPAGYGEFMVLYSLMLSVGNMARIFSTVSVKSIVENFEQKYAVLRFLRKFGLLFGILLSLSGLILSPFLKSFLKISYLPYVWVIALTWGAMFLVAVERSFLQATDRFGLFAFSSSLELTLRLMFTLIFFLLGFYIWGAIFPSLLALILIFILLLSINKNFFGPLKKIPLKKLFLIAAYSSPSGFFIYLDDIFIKRFFSPENAGYYASVSILGKALIWFSLTIFSVFFPKLVANKKNISLFKNLALSSVLLTTVIFILTEICILTIGKFVFIHLFGSKYLQAFSLLPLYIIAILPLTISIIIIGINTSTEKRLKTIYIHLFSYLLGFLILPFNNLKNYMLYIFCLNLFFCLISLFNLFSKDNHLPLSKPG